MLHGGYRYGEPCPPVGDGIPEYTSQYILKVSSLKLTENANPAMIGFHINANTIQKASFVMYYQRHKEPKK